MELGFIESLRRRWDVLGISLMTNDTTVKGKSEAEEIMDPSEHIGMEVLGEDEKSMEAEHNSENARLEEDEGVVARQQIVQGAIVKSVMTNAAKGLVLIFALEIKFNFGSPSPDWAICTTEGGDYRASISCPTSDIAAGAPI